MTPGNPKAGQRRLVKMSPPLEPWRPDPASTVGSFKDRYQLSERMAYIVRRDYDDYDRTTDFAVIQVRIIDGVDRRVAVYDACHGKGYHVHFHNSEGAEFTEVSLWTVDSYSDLDEALDHATEWISRNWRENERRSDHGK